MPGVILHLDMDAFFASVEQRDRPEWRGQPVIVGGAPGGRGVVCTASYEARRYGVHSGMPIRMACQLCPDAIFVPARFGAYEEASAQVMDICGRYTPLIEKVALDEAYLDLTGSERLLGKVGAVAASIRAQIATVARLPASAGVANGKAIAKIATGTAKPNGIRLIAPGEEAAFLAPLPVSKLPGVGPKMNERLEWLGITRIGQLAPIPQPLLVRQFGAAGTRLSELSRGIDRMPVQPNTLARSIGRETTFEEDIDSLEVIERWLLRLSDSVVLRLRRRMEHTRKVQLKLRLHNFTTLLRSSCLPEPTGSLSLIYRHALRLFYQEYRPGMRFRLLGVTLQDLDPGGGIQMDLFGNHRTERLEAATDRIRDRFGDTVIGPASIVLLA